MNIICSADTQVLELFSKERGNLSVIQLLQGSSHCFKLFILDLHFFAVLFFFQYQPAVFTFSKLICWLLLDELIQPPKQENAYLGYIVFVNF